MRCDVGLCGFCLDRQHAGHALKRAVQRRAWAESDGAAVEDVASDLSVDLERTACVDIPIHAPVDSNVLTLRAALDKTAFANVEKALGRDQSAVAKPENPASRIPGCPG